MTSKVHVPRAIRLLTQYGADALRPSVLNGRYMGALVSKRVAAGLKKRALIEGTYGSFIPNIGGWDATWDEPRKVHIIRPLKGHKEERTREERAQKIDAAMKAMPDKIKKYEQDAKDRKPKKDIFYQFKRVAELARGMRGKKL